MPDLEAIDPMKWAAAFKTLGYVGAGILVWFIACKYGLPWKRKD